ncbi:MAG: C69 family dipeptidase [Prevotella sp.]|jgi:dipeptidase|nr:C69 family dipeptidase [Prevotella sp.]
MRKKILFLIAILVALCCSHPVAACTNFIVGKKASADGSVICSYNADSYGAFMYLYHYPAAKHQPGDMRKVYEWDTNKYLGEIPEAPETYNVIGNINEWQVTIGETTFGGREEMVDTTGIIDYGSLIYIALQRSKTAREAISIMTSLVEQYGYCSEGETFTICDPNEAWIMEMMGAWVPDSLKATLKPSVKKQLGRTVWVARRIPDDMICGHANQSRITTFMPLKKEKKGQETVMWSNNVVSYARLMGWYDGKKDQDFSYNAAYAKPDFSGRRICDARVWQFFNRYADGMDRYIPWADGRDANAEVMPLWVKPNRLLTVQDVQAAMRDHFEGTPFDVSDQSADKADIGGGIWQMPYRVTPLYFEIDGKKCFNERPTSTQQTAWTFVSQMRSSLPREVGGCFWFGNDDCNMVAYTPVYCCTTRQPDCYSGRGADDVTFSMNNAFWVENWVSNMVYPRYSALFPDLKQVRDSLEQSYFRAQTEIEAKAQTLDSDARVKFLTDYVNQKADQMISRWRQLATFLIVRHNDMAVRPVDDKGNFKRNKYGLGERVERPGYPEAYRRELVGRTGNKLIKPAE